MIPEIGNFSLILALVFTLVLGVLPILGSLTGNQRLMDVAKPAVQVMVPAPTLVRAPISASPI